MSRNIFFKYTTSINNNDINNSISYRFLKLVLHFVSFIIYQVPKSGRKAECLFYTNTFTVNVINELKNTLNMHVLNY